MGIARGRLAAALLLGLAVLAAQADAQPGVKTARIGYAWLGPAGSDTPALDECCSRRPPIAARPGMSCGRRA